VVALTTQGVVPITFLSFLPSFFPGPAQLE
jgi:hypothetical protein